MHETPTAFVSEEFGLGRKNGARIVTVLAMLTGALCSLSLGPVPELQLFGKSLFDFFDFLSANILLTLGGFLTSIYVGWIMPHRIVRDQMTNWGTLSGRYFHIFVFVVKYICPVGMLFIFLHQFGMV
jgi:NSS family neurotransmitter:Na+ symporter